MKVLLTLLGALGVVCSFVLPQSPRPLVEVRCGMPPSACFELRPGQKEDEGTIRRILAGMLMNPLSIDVRNFVCAEVDGKLVGFGQVRPIGTDFELASLHVEESYRKRGIGSAVARQLLDDFVAAHSAQQLDRLFLLTLANTASFYEKLGFMAVPSSEIPGILKAERVAGSFVQSFFGNSLVCMRAGAG